MAMPGLRDQGSTNADEDPLEEVRTGSVVGIQIEGAGMYTGTLISDLMATVEQVGLRTQQQQAAEQRELHAIFSMQIPINERDQIFMGAA
jgi:hypothetical protein